MNAAEDLEELEAELEEQAMLSFYLQKVFMFYLEECRRNIELNEVANSEKTEQKN